MQTERSERAPACHDIAFYVLMSDGILAECWLSGIQRARVLRSATTSMGTQKIFSSEIRILKKILLLLPSSELIKCGGESHAVWAIYVMKRSSKNNVQLCSSCGRVAEPARAAVGDQEP